MNRKDFTKGQTVVIFSNYDDKGTWTWRRAVVASCGAKQMTLVDLDGAMLGRHFKPTIGTHQDNSRWGTAPTLLENFVLPDMSDEEIQTRGLAFAQEYQQQERTRYAACLAGGHGVSYNKAIQADLAALYEPRCSPWAQVRAEFEAAWAARNK